MAAPLVTSVHAGRVAVHRYQCRADHRDRTELEAHDSYALAYVERGSFGYRPEKQRHELIAGAILLGYPGLEYTCTHEHAVGDRCLSFRYDPADLEAIAPSFDRYWRSGALPPIATTMVLASAQGASYEELGLELAGRVIEALADRPVQKSPDPTPIDRRRAVSAAELIDARYADDLDLGTLATEVGLSPFHFLRTFSRSLGVTPYQYLLRRRLAAAARLLSDDGLPITQVALEAGFGDLSGFVRTFHKAAGCSPSAFRSKILQERRPVTL